jgi:tRNA A58 N-methylase Trm61
LLPLLAPAATAPAAEERDRILQALKLAPGMVVADVGAGDGRFSSVLSEGVGPRGRVYATEVDPKEVEKLEARARSEALANISVVVGGQDHTGLPPGCCDAVLLRLVYHHFTDPATMRRRLWESMRPGARIAVIDVPPQRSWRRLEGVPERGGHGIEAGELIAEMTSSGFELVERDDDWPGGDEDAYCVVFLRPPLDGAGAGR